MIDGMASSDWLTGRPCLHFLFGFDCKELIGYFVLWAGKICCTELTSQTGEWAEIQLYPNLSTTLNLSVCHIVVNSYKNYIMVEECLFTLFNLKVTLIDNQFQMLLCKWNR